jgi:GTP-binding protein Era
LINKAKDALQDIDLIIYVVDPGREIGAEERAAFGLIRHVEKPKILVINKSDLPETEREYQEQYTALAKDFDAVFLLSALRGSHIKPLKDKVMELLVDGEPLYPEDQWTNITHEYWIAEIIREKLFSVLDKEIPYSVSVEIDEVKEKDEIFVITGRILTDAERYKKILIGRRGAKIKEIGQMARRELEQALGKKVYLELEVVVDKHWIERI